MFTQAATVNTNTPWENVKANMKERLTNLSPFYTRTPTFFNDSHIYSLIHHDIPNLVTINDVDCKRAESWLSETYGKVIIRRIITKNDSVKGKHLRLSECIFCFEMPIVVTLNNRCSSITILHDESCTSQVETMSAHLSKLKERPSQQPQLHMLVNYGHGIEMKKVEISRPKFRLQDQYNDDFLQVDQVIHQRLAKKNDKGIVLLHGKPGTGKTSYIRYLISRIKKNVIFLPPGMAANFTHPEFISLIADYPNALLVIEDAESLLMDRNKGSNASVSGMLNLSDGLLSDCLNIQIVCSFNTDLSNIDHALMRRGRLIASYEFTALATEKAQKLSQKLGFTSEIREPMTLSAIYHQSETNYEPSKPEKIGF